MCTIGVDFEIKTVKLGDKVAKLQVWDTAGQERFRNITASYYRGAQTILLTFDVTDRESFLNIERWLDEIKLYATTDVQILLVANKVDMKRKRVVGEEEVSALSKKLGLAHIETSAKNAVNVNQAFMQIAETYVKEKARALESSTKKFQGDFSGNDFKGGKSLVDLSSSSRLLQCCTIL